VIDVLRAGPLTTVQDLGRPGWAHLGVPHSGALDQPALLRANGLVGNGPDAAGLEITLTGCSLRTVTPVTLAVTGAEATVTVDGRAAPSDAAIQVPAGATVRIGPARTGVRTYLGLAGGIAVAPVLGSRASDTLSGLGPAPLRDGQRLALGTPPPAPAPAVRVPPSPVATRTAPARRPSSSGPVLRLWPGPRVSWFRPDSFGQLCAQPYTVGLLSNRVGVRLAGPALSRAIDGELPSEGIVCGSVQVPADGQPLIFLADHPTTGGYPVIAVVDPADLPIVAQLRPGSSVRFMEVSRWT